MKENEHLKGCPCEKASFDGYCYQEGCAERMQGETQMRLVDASELMKQLVRAHLTYENGEEGLGYTAVCFGSVIRNAPTVDAVPVVHGHWRKEPFLMGTTHRCNLCGENYGMPHGIFNYCPNCGAKMDEEAKDGTERKAD